MDTTLYFGIVGFLASISLHFLFVKPNLTMMSKNPKAAFPKAALSLLCFV